MAKKAKSVQKPKRERKAKVAEQPEVVVVETVEQAVELVAELAAEQPEVGTNAQEQEDQMAETISIIFNKTKTNKQGESYFAQPGGGTFRVGKSFFVDGQLPESVELVVPVGSMPEPGKVKAPRVPRVVDPEKQAKREALAAKRAETAEKLRIRLAKLEAKLAPKTAAPAAEAPAEV